MQNTVVSSHMLRGVKVSKRHKHPFTNVRLIFWNSQTTTLMTINILNSLKYNYNVDEKIIYYDI